MTRGGAVACVVALGMTVAACSPTTYDESVATTADSTTTTSLPTGDASTLLPIMLTEVQALSSKILAGKGDREAATVIEGLWAEIKDQVDSTRPDLAVDFQFVLTRVRSAVDRNRAADADRAAKNLSALVTAYLG